MSFRPIADLGGALLTHCRACGVELTDSNWEVCLRADWEYCLVCRKRPRPYWPPFEPLTTLLEALESLEAVTDFVRAAQTRRPEYVPLVEFAPQVGVPDGLIQHALALAGSEGMPVRRLHETVPVSHVRFYAALGRLESSGMIVWTKESRPTTRGQRMQVVWRLSGERPSGPVEFDANRRRNRFLLASIGRGDLLADLENKALQATDPWSAAVWKELGRLR